MKWKQYIGAAAIVGLIASVSSMANADSIRVGDMTKELPVGITVFDIHNISTPNGIKDALTEKAWGAFKEYVHEVTKKIDVNKIKGLEQENQDKFLAEEVDYAIKGLERPNGYQLKGTDEQGHHIAFMYVLPHLEKTMYDSKYNQKELYNRYQEQIRSGKLENGDTLKKTYQDMVDTILKATNKDYPLYGQKALHMSILDSSGVKSWKQGDRLGFYLDMRASNEVSFFLQGYSLFLIVEYGPSDLNYVAVLAPDSSYDYWKRVLKNTWKI